MSRPVRVAVRSDQEVVAAGLVALLGRHPDRVQVVALGGAPRPDVVLYDVLGLLDGAEGELAAMTADPGLAVLAVARDLRPDLGARALVVGADGFVSLSVGDAELLRAVEATALGRAPASAGSSAAVEQRLGHDVGLTGREVEVLGLIAQGMSNQEIADHCYLSINSVKTYIRSAYRRIGVTNRSQAMVWALQHGFATDARDGADPDEPQRR